MMSDQLFTVYICLISYANFIHLAQIMWFEMNIFIILLFCFSSLTWSFILQDGHCLFSLSRSFVSASFADFKHFCPCLWRDDVHTWNATQETTWHDRKTKCLILSQGLLSTNIYTYPELNGKLLRAQETLVSLVNLDWSEQGRQREFQLGVLLDFGSSQ